MDHCKIVTDLLPTYCDELTGPETNTFIRDHLDSCPNCSKILEMMQQKREQWRDADVQRAQFKAALAGYERRHRRRVYLVVLACVLLIAVFFALRAFSFDLAIASSGLNRRELTVVQEPITGNEGKVFQIVLSRTKEDDCVLAYLEKNIIGFWTVNHVATPDEFYGAAQILWTEYLFSNRFGTPDITTVFHTVYAGCNAIDSFEKLPQEAFPKNVAVLVTQNSSNYYIHVITVLPDGGSTFDILPLLKENKLIG